MIRVHCTFLTSLTIEYFTIDFLGKSTKTLSCLNKDEDRSFPNFWSLLFTLWYVCATIMNNAEKLNTHNSDVLITVRAPS